MKRTITILAVAFATLGIISTSCSSSDNRDEQIQEKQDFTNTNYIKSLLLGKWIRTEVKLSQGWSTDNESGWESNYEFKADGTYSYKPYTKNNDSSLNKGGTYKITPATTGENATLTLSYSAFGNNFTDTIYLVRYENGIVEITQKSITTGTGELRERFKKQ